MPTSRLLVACRRRPTVCGTTADGNFSKILFSHLLNRNVTTSSVIYNQLIVGDRNNNKIINNNNNNNKILPTNNMSTKIGQKLMTMDTINPNVIQMEYAVRGPLVIRAAEIEKELEKGVKKPFNEVIRANIGDCHAMGQPYITFLRDVLALVVDPTNFNESKYPSDAKKRAQCILDGCGGQSVGSYSDSAGIECIRKHVAEYIMKRDAVMNLLNRNINGLPPGIMVPIPQYPLYSASIAEFGMSQIDYYLNEENKWSLDIPELERALNDAKKNIYPRALVVINPGNPTGQVLTKDNIQKIIKFAHEHSLFLFADEVYQDNIYDKDSAFHSVKKVLMEMGEPYNKMELASFMSCSKGYMGECGIRGGYCELINLDPNVRLMFQKSLSAQLCPTTIGQAAIDCVVNPPTKGEPSYEQFLKEKTTVLASLKERAELIATTLNSFEGYSCNAVQGAMYAFPQITLPPKAIEAAKKDGKPADTFYAFQLLEATGICIVSGSGFGQKPGTYHFRTTILPQTDKLKLMLSKFQKFHTEFMLKYK